MQFAPTDTTRAYRPIVDQVRDAIMCGELHVGDVLPPEREIAAQTGISRTSVREALSILADAGLLAMKKGGGGGTRVISDVIPPELLGAAIEHSRKRMFDMFEVRNALDQVAVELAAARASAAQLRAIRQVMEELEESAADGSLDADLFRTLDVRFHLLVVKAAGNATLLSTYNTFIVQIGMSMEMAPLSELVGHGLPTMKSLVKALEDRSPLDARLAMAAHTYPFMSIIADYFKHESERR